MPGSRAKQSFLLLKECKSLADCRTQGQNADMNEADQIVSKVAKLFDALSPTYDSVGVDFFQPIAASLIRSLPPVLGESWLDIGCGRGAVIDQIVKGVGPEGRITGTDISPGMIELFQEHINFKGYSNVSAEVDNAQDPHLPIESFNTISSSLVLFFLPNPLLALQRWVSSLVLGGRIGVTTFAQQDPRMLHVENVLQPFATPEMRDARVSGQKDSFASDKGMEDLLGAAGFINVRTVLDRIPLHFDSPQHWYDFSWSVGMRQMWLQVPDEEKRAVRAEAENRLREFAQTDGSILTYQGVRHTFGERSK
jgi:ubiquinone/menaquinone biosynthesis C-methylase UbiE